MPVRHKKVELEYLAVPKPDLGWTKTMWNLLDVISRWSSAMYMLATKCTASQRTTKWRI